MKQNKDFGKVTGGELTKKHPLDAGLDIKSNEDLIIPPRKSVSVSTGILIAVPNGYVGLIWSRSGLSFKNSIEVGAGCIDSNYRGEVKIKLYNHSNSNFCISKGDRIAQLLTLPVNLNEYVTVEELDETTRGNDGFGSTGK